LADEQQKDERQEINSDFSLFPNSLVNLTLLAQGIPHGCVVEMVKGLRSLRQAFKGFRPDHLPRSRVPSTLAQYAHHHPDRTGWFVEHWFHSKENAALRLYVSNKVDAEQLRQGIIEALAQAGRGKQELLLCALLLDERLEVREAINDELRQELLDKDSELVRQAEKRRQELEQEREAERRLKGAEEKAEEARHQLEEHIRQLEEYKEQLAVLQAGADEAEKSQVESENARQNAERERDEQRRVAEAAQIKQREAEGQSRQLEERNAELHSQLQNLGAAQDRVIELEAALNTSHALKKSAEMRCRHLEKERDKTQLLLDDERKHPRHTVSLVKLDESWREALSSLATHLRANAVANASEGSTVQRKEPVPTNVGGAAVETTQRANDWRAWQQLESDYARRLLDGSLFDSGCEPLPEEMEECLSEATRAQKLLALRWYLLEGFRQRLTESLQTTNLVGRESAGFQEESQPIQRSDSS